MCFWSWKFNERLWRSHWKVMENYCWKSVQTLDESHQRAVMYHTLASLKNNTGSFEFKCSWTRKVVCIIGPHLKCTNSLHVQEGTNHSHCKVNFRGAMPTYPRNSWALRIYFIDIELPRWKSRDWRIVAERNGVPSDFGDHLVAELNTNMNLVSAWIACVILQWVFVGDTHWGHGWSSGPICVNNARRLDLLSSWIHL